MQTVTRRDFDHSSTSSFVTLRSVSAKSLLFPIITKGKLRGSEGAAATRNSSCHFSKLLKDYNQSEIKGRTFALVKSNARMQPSVPL